MVIALVSKSPSFDSATTSEAASNRRNSWLLAAMSFSELGCIYASIILHDDGIAVTAEKINTVLKAANVSVESYWPGLFAKLAQSKNMDDLVLNAGAAGGAVVAGSAPAAAAGGAPAAEAPAAESKKEEAKEESDDDMGFSLFD
ncbi:hypothetical protein RJT34_01013 [Clitoria ternatea]|uniref:60S acidic ribosomal protein P1 n=1 Tax=Clitoria ternatea TaxID=43366 RepID=A0AAN9KIZ9_CLITE